MTPTNTQPNARPKGIAYKRFRIEPSLTDAGYWDVFTPEELELPKAFRNADMQCDTVQEAKDFIDSY